MNAPRSLLRDRQIRLHRNMQFSMRSVATHLEDVHARGGIIWIRIIAHLAHVEDTREQEIGRIQSRYTDHNGTQSSNLVLARNRAAIPRCRRVALTFVVV